MPRIGWLAVFTDAAGLAVPSSVCRKSGSQGCVRCSTFHRPDWRIWPGRAWCPSQPGLGGSWPAASWEVSAMLFRSTYPRVAGSGTHSQNTGIAPMCRLTAISTAVSCRPGNRSPSRCGGVSASCCGNGRARPPSAGSMTCCEQRFEPHEATPGGRPQGCRRGHRVQPQTARRTRWPHDRRHRRRPPGSRRALFDPCLASVWTVDSRLGSQFILLPVHPPLCQVGATFV